MIELNKIYNIDCLKGMDLMINQKIKFDAIITDPPYGNMDTDGGKRLGIKEWDKSIKPADIFEKTNKLLRKNGKLILFSQEPYSNKLINESINELKFSYRAIWEKDNFSNCLGCNKNMVNFTEDIMVFSKNHTKHDFEGFHPLRKYFKLIIDYIGLDLKQINNKLGHRKAEHSFYINTIQFSLCTEKTYEELINIFKIDRMNNFMKYDYLKIEDEKYRKNLIEKMNKEFPSIFNLWQGEKYKSNILKYKKDYEGLHPTQKPVKLIEDLIKTYTNEGDLILDFTIGSGTTAIACINTNRNYIGFELDENYYNIALKRIKKHQKE